MTRVDIRELPESVDKLEGVDFIEVEDKKERKLQGIFISYRLVDEFKKFLEEKKQKEIDERLKAFRSLTLLPKGSLVGESIQSIKSKMEI